MKHKRTQNGNLYTSFFWNLSRENQYKRIRLMFPFTIFLAIGIGMRSSKLLIKEPLYCLPLLLIVGTHCLLLWLMKKRTK